jgi:transketolase
MTPPLPGSPADRARKLEALARQVRRDVLELCYRAKTGHIGSSFSATDLLVALYFDFLRVNPARPEDPGRDRFIMSKGHACAPYFVCLQRRGFFPREVLEQFGLNGGTLRHHPDRDLARGIEATTGSLGHGLSLGTGMAMGGKLSSAAWRVAVLLSDGELQEGTVWEAGAFAAHHRLDNLLAIVDANGMQALGWTREILDYEDLAERWRAFGWGVRRIAGHDLAQIVQALEAVPFERGRPSMIIADTIKGRGVSFMENQLLWHYRYPNAAEFARAMKELEG